MTYLSDQLEAGAGQTFGSAHLVFDADCGECIVWVKLPESEVPKRMHLHSLDEIAGAFSVHSQRHWDPVSQDVARALKFAGAQIRQRLKLAGAQTRHRGRS